MASLTLVIGNKNYSSWSLRPWLLLKQLGIPFREKQLWIREPASLKKILKYSPGGRVPALTDGKIQVWESLAICEYLADKFPEAGVWPANRIARAYARCVSNEMHAGFQDLRKAMPFNSRKIIPLTDLSPEVRADIARICEIWRECRKKFGSGGPFLFGKFSAADAMYAPVCLRFHTYQTKLDAVCTAYSQAVINLPAVREWMKAAAQETRVIEASEIKLKTAR